MCVCVCVRGRKRVERESGERDDKARDTSLGQEAGRRVGRDNRRINHSNRRKRAVVQIAPPPPPPPQRVKLQFIHRSALIPRPRRPQATGAGRRAGGRRGKGSYVRSGASPWSLKGFKDFRGRCETRTGPRGDPSAPSVPSVPPAFLCPVQRHRA